MWTTLFEKLGRGGEYRGRTEGREWLFPIGDTGTCLTTDGEWGGCRVQSQRERNTVVLVSPRLEGLKYRVVFGRKQKERKKRRESEGGREQMVESLYI